MGDGERIREALLDLEREYKRERALREEAEALLGATRRLTSASSTQRVYEVLVETMRPLMGFETADVFELGDDGLLRSASRGEGLAAAVFEPGSLLRRVLSGKPVAAFDVHQIEEWKAQPDDLRDQIRSALHLPLTSRAVMICAHSERGFFGRRHLRIVKRVAPITQQALLTLENIEFHLQRVREEQVKAAALERTALLEHAMSSVGVAVAIVSEGDALCMVSSTLEQMTADWGEPAAWWSAACEQLPAPETAICGTCGRPAPRGTATVDLSPSLGQRLVTELTWAGHAHGLAGLDGDVLLVSVVTRWVRAEERLQRLNEELVNARDQALGANRAKSTFLANMSHELRTPLNAILGYTELLMEDLEEDPTVAGDLARIKLAAGQLLSLISDVLDLSKIDAGRMNVALEIVVVDELIQDLVATVDPLVRSHDNELRVHTNIDAAHVLADRVRLRQTLLNLLSNAAKFTRGGTITLTTEIREEQLGSSLVFEIADTGIGIPKHALEGLFKPFTQADNSATREYGGTGLGLTISKRLCELMGAELQAESEQHVGSVFRVVLPQETLATDKKAGAGVAVLVIDDDPAMHGLLRRFLEPGGYELLSAFDGRAGLDLARQRCPALICLDICMPVMDGWEVLERLKADPDTAGIPVVLVTVEDDPARGYALGADDYLCKPVTRDKVRSLTSRVARGGRRALVVEDDPASRELVCRLLEREGWSVTTAENGLLALDALERSVPDLVVLDLMMPEMDGFEVLDHMRVHQDWRRVPVVVLTAMDLHEDHLKRLEPASVIHKGKNVSRLLLAEVRRALSARASAG